MTDAEWATCDDPPTMIDWLAGQGYHAALWDFTAARCEGLRDQLPGPTFHVLHLFVAGAGWQPIDAALAEAADALGDLVDDWRATGKDVDLGRKIDAAYGLFALHCQDPAEAAHAIAKHLGEAEPDAAAQMKTQTDLLRRLVPDPSPPAPEEDG